MPREIEEALASWRDAQRRLDNAMDGDREALEAEVERGRTEFHRLSAEHMMKQIDALHDAEARRKAASPSSDPFHEAAREEMEIAAEIWNSARVSDEEIPAASPQKKDEPSSS